MREREERGREEEGWSTGCRLGQAVAKTSSYSMTTSSALFDVSISVCWLVFGGGQCSKGTCTSRSYQTSVLFSPVLARGRMSPLVCSMLSS